MLLLLGIVALWVQDFISAKAPAILVGLVVQAVQVSLNSGSSVPSPSLFCLFGVICKLRENWFGHIISWPKNTEWCQTLRSSAHDQLTCFSLELQTTSPEMEESLREEVFHAVWDHWVLVLPVHWGSSGDEIDGFVPCSDTLKLVLEDWRCSDLAFEVTCWPLCKTVLSVISSLCEWVLGWETWLYSNQSF